MNIKTKFWIIYIIFKINDIFENKKIIISRLYLFKLLFN